MKTKLTQNAVEQALIESAGNVHATSRILGCTRKTVYDKIKKWEWQDKLTEIRELYGLGLAWETLVNNLDDPINARFVFTAFYRPSEPKETSALPGLEDLEYEE